MLAAATAAPSLLQFVPINDEAAIRWVGRRFEMAPQVPVNALDTPAIVNASTAYAIDWEGTEAEIGVANASVIAAVIYDKSAGNSRFAAYLNTLNVSSTVEVVSSQGVTDPNPFALAVPGLRTGLITTAPWQTVYVLAAGKSIGASAVPSGVRVRLRLLTEPSAVDDGCGVESSTSGPLQLVGFLTDGVVLPARPLAKRRIEFLGDSLTAGYGAGFDDPAAPPPGGRPTPSSAPSLLPCGAGVPVNDVSSSYGARLCDAFGADCTWTAVSGVTIWTGRPSLPQYWNATLGSMLTPSKWSGAGGAVAWDPCNPALGGGVVPDAVYVNLGENDMHGAPAPPIPASWFAGLAQSYVDFVAALWAAYAKCGSGVDKGSPAFFLAIGPHEAGQSVAIAQALPAIAAAGYTVTFINATVPNPPVIPAGCGGHPGPSLHLASAQRAAPVISHAMQWDYAGL